MDSPLYNIIALYVGFDGHLVAWKFVGHLASPDDVEIVLKELGCEDPSNPTTITAQFDREVLVLTILEPRCGPSDTEENRRGATVYVGEAGFRAWTTKILAAFDKMNGLA